MAFGRICSIYMPPVAVIDTVILYSKENNKYHETWYLTVAGKI